MTQPNADAATGGTTDANGSVTDAGATVDPNAVDAKPGEQPIEPGQDANKDDGLKKALQQERMRANQAEKKLREQELAKLPELERLKTENEGLTKENEKLTLENRQMRIGMKHKLPLTVSKRLRGDTDEEMEDDAKELLEHYKVDNNIDSDSKEKKRPPNDGKASAKDAKGYDMNKLMRIAAGRG